MARRVGPAGRARGRDLDIANLPMPEVRTPPRNAVVIGGGSCVWDDLQALEALCWEADVFWPELVVAANDVGAHYPGPLTAWATLHPERLQTWLTLREENGFSIEGVRTYAYYGSKRRRPADALVGRRWIYGASGYLAIGVALEAYGADKVILCGVPMTKTPHFEESTVHRVHKPWRSADFHSSAWLKTKEALTERGVRSMSGQTAEWLGVPTVDWLRS